MLNDPINWEDIFGLEAYIASRDLWFNGNLFSHNFIVISTEKGNEVISFGPAANGTLQNVVGSSINDTDIKSLLNSDTKYTKINASDSSR